ncbi:hypothetical protein D3C87_82680 [compost metagenome]
MDELINYIWDKEANTIRKQSDEDCDQGRKKSEEILAQFEGEEDCEQFEMAVRRLRPDLKWLR